MTAQSGINKVFNKHVTLKIDHAFALKVVTHVHNFTRKDSEFIEFFGGNLIGVNKITWSAIDSTVWIEDILEVSDYDLLCSEIWELPHINKNWQIACNPINLSFLWLCHQALVSNILSQKDKDALAAASLNMLQYRFITSIHSHNFRFPANISIALAVYEGLDNKSQLKKYGSWQGLVDARTEDILGHDSLHASTIRTLESDKDIINMVNDIWNRLKSIFKILTADFHRIKDTNARISSTTKYTTVDGEMILKDSINKYAHIKSLMHDIIPDRNSFIREDLLNIITLTVTTVYPEYLKTTLTYISENYNAKHKYVFFPGLIDDILMYAFDIIRHEKIELDNLPAIAIKMRGMFRSSRVTDPLYISIKHRLNIIIEDANPKINEANNSSTKIAVNLYIILRALLKT